MIHLSWKILRKYKWVVRVVILDVFLHSCACVRARVWWFPFSLLDNELKPSKYGWNQANPTGSVGVHGDVDVHTCPSVRGFYQEQRA